MIELGTRSHGALLERQTCDLSRVLADEHMAHSPHILPRLYLPVIMMPLVAYLFKHRHALSIGERAINWWHDVLPAALHRYGLDTLYARLHGTPP